MRTVNLLIMLIAAVSALKTAAGLEAGGMPEGAKPVPRARWTFEPNGRFPGYGAGVFLETKNTFGRSTGAARLAPGQVWSTNLWSSYDYGADDNTNFLRADMWCTLAYYAENLTAIEV